MFESLSVNRKKPDTRGNIIQSMQSDTHFDIGTLSATAAKGIRQWHRNYVAQLSLLSPVATQ